MYVKTGDYVLSHKHLYLHIVGAKVYIKLKRIDKVIH